MMRMTGQQYEQLMNALVAAFPSQSRLAQMVRFRLDKHLSAMALGESLQEIAFRLIGVAEAEGWTEMLILGARESNPSNPYLLSFSQQFGLTSIDPSTNLEKIIKDTNLFFDVYTWRRLLGEIETQVCRIEIPTSHGITFGTGFLLGPDLVMTNYHVVEALILRNSKQGTKAHSGDVILRFDYK